MFNSINMEPVKLYCALIRLCSGSVLNTENHKRPNDLGEEHEYFMESESCRALNVAITLNTSVLSCLINVFYYSTYSWREHYNQVCRLAHCILN